MTNNDETYNGWTNRETWALNLWLTNDQGLYEMTRERVADAVNEYSDGYEQGDGMRLSDILPRIAGETVRAVWEELTDPNGELMDAVDILQMVRDVGGEYRVNWDEIGAAWLPENDD
jgi:hypothetical protein